METMLAGMFQNEFDQWTQSFEKMKAGDMTVLSRPTPVSSPGRHMSVPAPGFTRCQLAGNNLADTGHTAANRLTIVKHEVETEQDLEERPLPFSQPTTAIDDPVLSASSPKTVAPRVAGPTVSSKVGTH